MKERILLAVFIFGVLLSVSAEAQSKFTTKKTSFKTRNSGSGGNNLIVNGDFEDPENPLKYWGLDYDWMNNQNYKGTMKGVEFVKTEGSKRNLLKVTQRVRETPITSPLAKFEYGKRYNISFDVKYKKVGHSVLRMYVKGFKYKSGIRPYPNPHLGDLTHTYKGENQGVRGSGWQRKTITFPFKDYDDMSPLAKKNLKYLRLFGLYAIMVDGPTDTTIWIDNLTITEK